MGGAYDWRPSILGRSGSDDPDHSGYGAERRSDRGGGGGGGEGMLGDRSGLGMEIGSLERCLAGVERVLLNSGPTQDLVQLQTNLVRAAKRARVGQVVKFSCVGADSVHMSGRVRFIDQHRAVERELMQSGVAWTM